LIVICPSARLHDGLNLETASHRLVMIWIHCSSLYPALDLEAASVCLVVIRLGTAPKFGGLPALS
jgi:hypothetical protein